MTMISQADEPDEPNDTYEESIGVGAFTDGGETQEETIARLRDELTSPMLVDRSSRPFDRSRAQPQVVIIDEAQHFFTGATPLDQRDDAAADRWTAAQPDLDAPGPLPTEEGDDDDGPLCGSDDEDDEDDEQYDRLIAAREAATILSGTGRPGPFGKSSTSAAEIIELAHWIVTGETLYETELGDASA